MTLTRALTTLALCAACALTTWVLVTHSRPEAAAAVPAPPVSELACPAPAPPAEDVATSHDLATLRGEVAALSGEVRALSAVLLRQATQPPSPSPSPTLPSSAGGPARSVAGSDQGATEPLASAPAPAAVASDERLISSLDELARAADARAEHQNAVRAAVSSLHHLGEQLTRGDTDGVLRALDQAAEVLDGPAAEELRGARLALENEDLTTARQHIEIAMLRSR
jgi:hypothetical protein